MPVDKINGVSLSAISKINGVAKANIAFYNRKVITKIPIPTGLIIPYNTDGADPSGWVTYTDADGKYIIGAGDTYDAEDTGAGGGAKTITVESAGAHSGTSSPTIAASAGGDCGTSAEAAHDHTMELGTYVPHYQQSRFIKANAGQTIIPQYGVIQTWDRTFGIENIWTSGRMLKSNTALGAAGASTHTGLSTNTVSGHKHGDTMGTASGGDQDKTEGAGSAQGGHNHTGITATITNTIRQYALAAWANAAADVDLEAGMIGMFESLTPPENWSLCDGNNGTPDLRNYFIKHVAEGDKGAATGDGTLTVTATLTHGSHGHFGDTAESVGGTAIHSEYTMPPHTVNQNYSWLPAYYALAFIMKD